MEKLQKEIDTLKLQVEQLTNLEKGVKKMLQPDQIERMKNPKVGNNKKWSSVTLQLCLQLYLMIGPAGYNFLRKERNFPGPCESTLKYYMRMIKMEPGVISDDIMRLLSKKVEKMPLEDRYCALILDEMAIQAEINYDDSSQSFIGHPTMAQSKKQRKKKLSENPDWTPLNDVATKALNFEIAGLGKRWKQIILVHFTCDSIDAKELKKVLFDVIRRCYSIGLKIVVCTMDSASSNQAL